LVFHSSTISMMHGPINIKLIQIKVTQSTNFTFLVVKPIDLCNVPVLLPSRLLGAAEYMPFVLRICSLDCRDLIWSLLTGRQNTDCCGYEGYRLLECETVYFGRNIPTFRRNELQPFFFLVTSASKSVLPVSTSKSQQLSRYSD